jgi:hypothetical protein
VSRWSQKVWEPTPPMRQLVSYYELLCRAADVRGLRVELRIGNGPYSDVRLSNGMSEDLYGIDDLERAAQGLCGKLAREVSR